MNLANSKQQTVDSMQKAAPTPQALSAGELSTVNFLLFAVCCLLFTAL